MNMNPPQSAPRDRTSELRLSAQQQYLLDEALSLLIDMRSRALDIAAQVCRRQGGAVPGKRAARISLPVDG